jgi:hypothetical protein
MGGVGLALNLAFPTATLFPYLAYRAIIALWRAGAGWPPAVCFGRWWIRT